MLCILPIVINWTKYPNYSTSSITEFEIRSKNFELSLQNYCRSLECITRDKFKSISGFKTELGLTGFKWLGNKSDELRRLGKTVLFAWEESIGFMLGHALEKDGITAAAIFAELASYLYSKQLTLAQQLLNVYSKQV